MGLHLYNLRTLIDVSYSRDLLWIRMKSEWPEVYLKAILCKSFDSVRITFASVMRGFESENL